MLWDLYYVPKLFCLFQILDPTYEVGWVSSSDRAVSHSTFRLNTGFNFQNSFLELENYAGTMSV